MQRYSDTLPTRLAARADVARVAQASGERRGPAPRDPIARSIGLDTVSSLSTRPIQGSRMMVSRLSIGADRLGLTRPVPAEDAFVVAVYLHDLADHELWSRGRPVLRQGYAAQSMRIVSLQDEYAANLLQPHETLVFHIPRLALDGFTDDAGFARVGHLACEPGLVDPVVGHLAGALSATLAMPAVANSLFVDQVCLSVCAHLAGHYGGQRRAPLPAASGLSPGMASRAKELLAAHVAETLSIEDLAQACGLSRSHFGKAFKLSTGLTPHAWRQQYRIERAQALLLGERVDLAAIAALCGFADQSHFNRVFARLVGDTPGNWRRMRLR
jgi:AraC family transcriptional regulator